MTMHPPRQALPPAHFLAWLMLSMALLLALLIAPAHAATVTLTPTAYQTTRGSDSGQPPSTLGVRDQSGTGNTWGKYIEFTPKSAGYIGTLSFALPATVAANTVSALQVQVNYQGPASTAQSWTWKIRNWHSNALTSLGTNAGAPSWGAWKLLTFNLGSAASEHVRASDGKIELQLTSSNSADSADIDYTAIIATYTTGGGGGDGSVTGVTVSPTSTSVPTGQTRQLTAVVQGGSNGAVNWSVNGIAGGNAGVGTISPNGLYTAPTTPPAPATVTVQAASVAAPSKTASASITVIQDAGPTGPLRYVATDGNDNNPGTLAAPWKTIGHAASVVQAGDTVQVRGGEYAEIVRLRRSGQPGLPITIQSYPGEKAIIEGKDQIVDGEVGLVTLDNVSHVTFAGFEIRNFRTANALDVPLGIMVIGSGTDIAVRNNLIHNIANTSSDARNRNAYGLAVFGTNATASLKNVTIDGNELHTLTLGNSESFTINGNVEFWTVSNNIVHDTDNIGIDAIGWEGRAGKDAPTDYARDGVIRGNLVYRLSSSNNPSYPPENGEKNYSAGGIYVDGGARILIEQNTVHHTDYGIELASEAEGQATNNVILRNNLIWASTLAGITIGGYEDAAGATDKVTIVNNTLLFNNALGWEAEFQMQHNATNVTFKNNILYTTPENSFLYNTTDAVFGLDIDNNLYYSTGGAGNARFTWGTEYTSFANWQRIGKDAGSRFANPLLAAPNATSPNLKPQPGSPAVGKGVNLGVDVVGTLDVANQARVQGAIDIGAYEQ